jgi:leader peptidase (prepilin peptidase)/N-methyltransferase
MNLEMWYHSAADNWFASYGLVYPGVWGFVLFWVFAFGACIGSFLNVCIWRIPRGESLSKASSHCTVCGNPIKWFDNIPVISYLVLRGRCRSCRTPYSCSYFVVELICGILTVLTVFKTGICSQSAAVIPARMLLVFFGVSCAMTDIRFRTVPDKLTYTGMLLALLTAALCPAAWGTDSFLKSLQWSFFSGVLPAAFLLIFAEIGKWAARQDVIGMGDVKFVALCGMLIGLPGTVFAVMCGSFAGTLWGLAVKRKLNVHLAFVPFIALSALVWIFFDRQILDFYIALFNN